MKRRTKKKRVKEKILKQQEALIPVHKKSRIVIIESPNCFTTKKETSSIMAEEIHKELFSEEIAIQTTNVDYWKLVKITVKNILSK